MNVSIVKIGYPQVDLQKVTDIINNNQNLYKIEYLTSIPSIGKPDLEDYSYSDILLFEKLSQHIDSDRLTLGITSVPLESRWWIRPNSDRTANLITIDQADTLIEQAKRSIEDFVILKVLTCILTSEFFRRSKEPPLQKLIHYDCRSCIFDFCPDEQERWRALKALQIDHHCRGILLEGNVPIENIQAIESVMVYMKQPTIKKSVYSIIDNFWLSGLVGIGIGIMINTVANLLVKSDNITISIILFLIFTVGTIFGKYFHDLLRCS